MKTKLIIDRKEILERNRTIAFSKGNPFTYFISESETKTEYPDGRAPTYKRYDVTPFIARNEHQENEA